MSDENERSVASAGSIASPFEKILLATIAMHELEWRGKADSDEADAIRDTVDEPWRSITDSERETARAVSAALQRARQ